MRSKRCCPTLRAWNLPVSITQQPGTPTGAAGRDASLTNSAYFLAESQRRLSKGNVGKATNTTTDRSCNRTCESAATRVAGSRGATSPNPPEDRDRKEDRGANEEHLRDPGKQRCKAENRQHDSAAREHPSCPKPFPNDGPIHHLEKIVRWQTQSKSWSRRAPRG
jgi:hypothetical protein